MKKNIAKIILALEIFCLPFLYPTDKYFQEKNNISNYAFNCDRKIPANVKERVENLIDFPFREKPVLVRVSKCIDSYIITSKNGFHIKVLAKRIGIPTPTGKSSYENYDTAFSQEYENILGERISEIDSDKNKIIETNEY